MLADKMRMRMEQRTGDAARPLDCSLLVVSGERAKIEGKFEIADSLDVECEIAGELDIKGTLTIGEQGVVRAAVKTVDAVIRGRYEGELIATGDVEITETGRVNGNIHTDSLVIAKGGAFNGKVIHTEEERPRRQDGAQPSQQQPGKSEGAQPLRPGSGAPVRPSLSQAQNQNQASPGDR